METSPSSTELSQQNTQLRRVRFPFSGAVALIVLSALLGAGWALRSRFLPLASTPSNTINAKLRLGATGGATAGATASPAAQIGVKLNLPAQAAPIAVPTLKPTDAPTPPPTPVVPANFVAKAATNAPTEAPNPLFSPNHNPALKRPVFVCGTDSFASYITLLQIQVAGLDVRHGFDLGIVPLQFNDREYALSQQDIDAALKTGAWDCNPNTVDGVASTGNGVITAIVDESAGGDGIWARQLGTIYDLKGKRIAYVADSSSEFFARYALSVAQLDPSNDAVMVPFDTPDEAVQAFNAGKADAVSAWEPQLSQAAKGGGQPLVTSDQLRIIVDTIITSRKSIAERPEVVQAFHDAWFDALKFQFEHFDDAARQIAAWGNPDWSGITQANAGKDFGDSLRLIAQADLQDNLAVMNNPEPIINLMNASRRVWSLARKVPSEPVEMAIDARFVKAAAALGNEDSGAKPINDTFSLAAAALGSADVPAPTQPMTETAKVDKVAVIAQATATTATTAPALAAASAPSQTVVASSEVNAEELGVLPCRHFTFLPDSAVLTDESRKVLDLCVIPLLQQRAGTALRIRGSAAWPGPKGSYTETQIMEMAIGRAQAIADYLKLQKIDSNRLLIEGTLPPLERRESDDPIQQIEDRFVEMTLLTSGR